MKEVSEPISIGRQSLIEMQARSEARSSTPGIARLLELTVFYGLLGVIALTAIPYGTVDPWWVAVFECLVFLFGILAAIEAFINKSPRNNYLSLAAPFVILALFIWWQSLPLFSRAQSADPYNSRLFGLELVALVVMGVLLARYTTTNRRLRSLVYVVIGIGVASAVFALVRKSTQTGPSFLLPRLPLGDRTFGLFINKNHFAFLMEMTLGLTLALLLSGLKQSRRVAALLPIAALLWAALVISNSRGGVLASLCVLLFLGVILDPVKHLPRKHVGDSGKRLRAAAGGLVLRGVLIACLIVLFGYGVAWIGGEPVVTNLQTATTDFGQSGANNNANTSRQQMWSTTWKVFKDHPLTGIGFGAYWIGVTKYHDASGQLTPQQAHNDYLDLLAAGGLVGCALVIWFGVVFLKRVREQLRSPDPYRRAACVGALAGIFGVAVHSFVDFGLHITVNAAVFVILLVIAAVKVRVEEPALAVSE